MAFEVLNPDAISDTLKCPVCMDIFEDPVFLAGQPCQHVFCRVCVEQALNESGHCPSCRAVMRREDLKPHQTIRSLLDEMIVRCTRHCGWTGRRDSLVAHESECPLARIVALEAELRAHRELQADMEFHLSSLLETRVARVDALEAELRLREERQVDINHQLLKRDVRISFLETRVARIDTLEAELRARETQQADIDHRLSIRDARILFLETRVAEQDAQSKAYCLKLKECEGELTVARISAASTHIPTVKAQPQVNNFELGAFCCFCGEPLKTSDGQGQENTCRECLSDLHIS